MPPGPRSPILRLRLTRTPLPRRSRAARPGTKTETPSCGWTPRSRATAIVTPLLLIRQGGPPRLVRCRFRPLATTTPRCRLAPRATPLATRNAADMRKPYPTRWRSSANASATLRSINPRTPVMRVAIAIPTRVRPSGVARKRSGSRNAAIPSTARAARCRAERESPWQAMSPNEAESPAQESSRECRRSVRRSQRARCSTLEEIRSAPCSAPSAAARQCVDPLRQVASHSGCSASLQGVVEPGFSRMQRWLFWSASTTIRPALCERLGTRPESA